MTGLELIAWAVRMCAANRWPPTDANILFFIRTRPEEL
jgi:hypothetical protein